MPPKGVGFPDPLSGTLNTRCVNRTCSSHTSIGERHWAKRPGSSAWACITRPIMPNIANGLPAKGTGETTVTRRRGAGLALRTSAERARSGLLSLRFGLVGGRRLDFALDLATMVSSIA
jgi:hypothetical protein